MTLHFMESSILNQKLFNFNLQEKYLKVLFKNLILLFYSYAIVNLVANTKINCIFINFETKKKKLNFIHD